MPLPLPLPFPHSLAREAMDQLNLKPREVAKMFEDGLGTKIDTKTRGCAPACQAARRAGSGTSRRERRH